MCLSGRNQWKLAGLLSYQRYCGRFVKQPTTFSSIHSMLPWINKVSLRKPLDSLLVNQWLFDDESTWKQARKHGGLASSYAHLISFDSGHGTILIQLELCGAELFARSGNPEFNGSTGFLDAPRTDHSADHRRSIRERVHSSGSSKR